MITILDLLKEANAEQAAKREEKRLAREREREAKRQARGISAARAANGSSSFADNFLYAPTAEEMAAIRWTKTALVQVTLEQTCECGSLHRASQGLFVKEEHPRLRLSRMRRSGLDAEDWLTLPLIQDTVVETVGACHECFAAVKLIREALFDPRLEQLELPFGAK